MPSNLDASVSPQPAMAALDEAEWALARALRTRSYAETVTQDDAA